ncbi:MAG: hypothetical protein HY848_11755 [Betaproteobacteria bacterium]|nr:hypothetical protein [Betaproteobacteria bacterium]
MWLSIARAAIVALAFVTSPARADDLADFNAAVENASAHNRVAIGYLRTGNLDLALLEIDRLREAWGVFERRFAGKRPAAFDGVALYGTVFTGIPARFVGIDLMISMGKPDAVRQALEAIRGDLYDLRKAAGIVVLADCVRDANAGMDALMVYDDRALDFTKPATRNDLAGKAQSYGATLSRCDGIASEAVRNSAEFRRLIDGAKASLTLIPKAIETRDGDLLHRVLIELRSFDNLLAFRFG